MKKNKIIYLVIFLLIVILIVGFLLILNYLKYNNDETRYYEEKMKVYGFDKMYNNAKTKPSEVVQKSEAVKMVLAALKNTYKLNNVVEDKFLNYNFVEYAESIKILEQEKITKENYNQPAELKEIIDMLVKGKIVVLKKEVSKENVAKYSNISKLNSLEKEYVNDLVLDGILENTSKKINMDKKIHKKDLNKIIVEAVQAYQTISFGENIRKDKSTYPNNANLYPYILEDVANEIYELPFNTSNPKNSMSPVSNYRSEKDNIGQLLELSNEYLNTILNIDYETINEEKFTQIIKEVSAYGYQKSQIEKYIKYVKDNKIKLKGSAKAQMPAFYYDGTNNIVRYKVELEVINSNTMDNLLYYDLETSEKITYNKKSEYVIDLKLMYSFDNYSLFVDITNFSDYIIK